jgi:hypothetical protein
MSESLVDTMIRKMENTINTSTIIRQLILNFNTPEDIIYRKSEIFDYLYNIEDDIREYIKFTKSLNTITNDLQEEYESLRSTCELNEYKINTMEETQLMLRDNIRELVEQLHQFEEKNLKNEEYIRQLEDSLTEAEQLIKNKNVELDDVRNAKTNYSNSIEYNYGNEYSGRFKYDNYTRESYSPMSNNQYYHYTNNNSQSEYNSNVPYIKKQNVYGSKYDYSAGYVNIQPMSYSDEKYNTISRDTNNDYPSSSTREAKTWYNENDNLGSLSNRSNEHEECNKLPEPEKLNDYRERKYEETDISTKREGKNEIEDNIYEVQRTEEREAKTKEQKTRGQRVVDIVMKINSNDAINAILKNMYGESILDKVVSPETEEGMLDEFEEVIRGIEKIIENEKIEKNQSKANTIKNTNETIEERPEEEAQQSKSARIIKKNKSYNSIHSIKEDEPPFEETLRKSHYPCNNIKVYKPYTKPHGSYFDPILMKGGQTSITSPKSARIRKESSTRKNNKK